MNLFESISRWWNRSRPWATPQELSDVRKEQTMDKAELNAKLDGIAKNLDEAATEIVAELGKLREQVANGGIPTEIMARIDGIAEKAKNLADIIPGSPAPADPAQ